MASQGVDRVSTPSRNSRLCSRHFLSDCFKEDAYAKYGIGGPESKRRTLLKDDAVPTEFVHRHAPQPKRSSSRLEKRERQEKLQQLLAESSSKELAEPESSSASGSIVSTRTKQVGPPFKKKQPAETMTQAMTEPHEEQQHEESHEVGEPDKGETELFMAPEILPLQAADIEMPSAMYVQQPLSTHPQSVFGTPRRTRRDHSYASKLSRTFGTQTESYTIQTTRHIQEVEEPPSSSPMKSAPESDLGMEMEAFPEYLPSSGESSESIISEEESPKDNYSMMKYIVFEENLEELHKCKTCGSPVTHCSKFTQGSMVGYKISCHAGHSYVWHSQPQICKQPVGNLLITAAVIVAGSTYAKISAFAGLLNLQFLSKSVFNKVQRESVHPVIQKSWEEERSKAVGEIKPVASLVLTGDGRCDSPGHTAKYGSYTLMHTDGDGQPGTRKIVSMKLVQVSEVKNSNHMEPEGLRRCLKEVTDDGVNVGILATDRHNMVTGMMKKDYDKINHQFDVWHLAKGVIKKLTAKAKTKGCEDLSVDTEHFQPLMVGICFMWG